MSDMLEGKTAFVTGGTGGIGSAICARFAREGAQVIAADLSQRGELPDPVEFITYDVTDEKVCQATFTTLAERWDKLDILVNAAGIEIEKTIEETSLEEWNRIFAINVTGMFLTSKYALPLLRKSDGASVINFGSYDGYIADPGLAAYCATKGAVHAL
ncbi:MAG: SDR family oxidoreductase, partial [Gammaproteobacteria bacterium]|nr:SDR family oxidoreductase [Gammaproteobacteria bacterium]